MHPGLDKLQPYPFQKLARLFQDLTPPSELSPISLSIGEPKHPAPGFVLSLLADNLPSLSSYPLTKGSAELREAISAWLQRRYAIREGLLDPNRHVLPVNGTREALFAFAQCIVDTTATPLVMMPNPFYQIYEGAAILAGAEPYFLNTTAENAYLPDLDVIPEQAWQRCQLFYACSPGNPTGAVFPREYWLRLLDYADRYDFVVAADECYSEIYPDEAQPPVGLLQVCAESGRDDFARCVSFNSLSKRSNLPGLRSGFVAGDAAVLERFLLYRTYHGCAMSLPTQVASAAAWNDEAHVQENREQYRQKFAAVLPILSPWLDVQLPQASFYLWPQTPQSDTAFAQGLYRQAHITALPGSYLSRDTAQGNPGTNRIRLALVAETTQCIEAAERIADYCQRQ